MIPLRRLLDPRTAPEPPVVGAVWVPAAELEDRVHELPPRGEAIDVAELEGADVAMNTLVALGRCPSLVSSIELGPSMEPGRLWRPNAFLECVEGGLRRGDALDVACGVGREAVFLASAGWQVTGLDWLPDALERAEDLRRRYAPETVIRWVNHDVESRPDVSGAFDLVTSFFFLDRRFLGRIGNLLRAGGHAVVETFTRLHRERHGKPNRERFVLELGELPSLVPDLEVVSFDEGWRPDGRHTARLWARKSEG
jgi:SAM-dependent methyltransferase